MHLLALTYIAFHKEVKYFNKHHQIIVLVLQQVLQILQLVQLAVLTYFQI